MNNRNIEFLVGCFVLFGLCALIYLAVGIGSARLLSGNTYQLKAQFSSAVGVNPGSRVEIAGVRIGKVVSVELDDIYSALVVIELSEKIVIDEDAIASVKTSGLIGDRFIELSPGGSDTMLSDGDYIYDTVSALDIEDIVGRIALGGLESEDD